jgi:hypothetical protein
LAGLYDLDELGLQWRRRAAQVGMEQAERWVALTDGGNGLEEFIRHNFGRPEVVLILDFGHAAGHGAELAKAPFGEGSKGAVARAGQWCHQLKCHQLKHEGGAALVAPLEGRGLKGGSAEAAAHWEKELGYFRGNVPRMDYPTYRAAGWQIGSGPVESACKVVVGGRLKGGGMRWGEDGADAVCHLRALFKSAGDGWEAFWRRSINESACVLPIKVTHTLARPAS